MRTFLQHVFHSVINKVRVSIQSCHTLGNYKHNTDVNNVEGETFLLNCRCPLWLRALTWHSGERIHAHFLSTNSARSFLLCSSTAALTYGAKLD